MRVLVAALVAFGILGGCLGGDDSAPADAAPSNVITDPLDYSYLKNGTDDGAHIHDYWNGQKTIPIAGEQTSGGYGCNGCDQGMTVLSARPPSGTVVPQGARWINMTFAWQEDGQSGYETAEAWIKTAADDAPRSAGPVENGVAFTFESANDQADPPHHVLSLWEFQLRFNGTGGQIRFTGDIQFTAEATRGWEIPPWPAHPDHWKGETELAVIDREATVVLFYRVEPPDGGSTSSCYFGCEFWHAPDAGVIVPPLTDHVDVVLTFQAGAIPAGVGLRFHGSDSWDLTELTPEESTPVEWRYRIPITPGLHDSPYALQSLWEFQLYLDQAAPFKTWHGEYHLTVTAIKA